MVKNKNGTVCAFLGLGIRKIHAKILQLVKAIGLIKRQADKTQPKLRLSEIRKIGGRMIFKLTVSFTFTISTNSSYTS